MISKKRTNSEKQIKVKSLAITTIFASLWIAAELSIGPFIGRLKVGPISLHGAVNRVIGWYLMAVMTGLTSGFGNITLMSLVAAFGTRVFRPPSLESIVVGTGYALGGLLFDLLYFKTGFNVSRNRTVRRLMVATISAAVASAPYMLWKLTTLGFSVFILFSPIYVLNLVKGIIFSIIGTILSLKSDIESSFKILFSKGK